ncbi:hypothetical protein [Streptomyces mashuensis]|nr:hypothetical protein [Streptomyces mashuensis]
MPAVPSYDRRPLCRSASCPRCNRSVRVSRCRTAAREVCGWCGNEFSPLARVERAGVLR